MTTLVDQAITTTAAIEAAHTPLPEAGPTSWAIAAGAGSDLACAWQFYAGATLGWVTYYTQTITAGTADVVVIDHPKLRSRVVATPSAGAGHAFIGVGDAGTRGP